jgi:hypothetical protein
LFIAELGVHGGIQGVADAALERAEPGLSDAYDALGSLVILTRVNCSRGVGDALASWRSTLGA